MALNIPYPDMDFVPLDILTALELDQMVANIEYIANDAFPVTNANIADSAVTAGKINTGAVTKAKLASAITNISDYSTTEKSTGFTWTDGKTIYKKTINFGALPNATAKSVNLSITNLGVIINTEAFCVYSNGINFPIPFTNTNDFASSVMLNYSSTQVTITTGTDRSSATGYVTIFYTKTA